MKKFYVGHLFQVQIEKPFSLDSVSSSCQQSQIAAGHAVVFCSMRHGKAASVPGGVPTGPLRLFAPVLHVHMLTSSTQSPVRGVAGLQATLGVLTDRI